MPRSYPMPQSQELGILTIKNLGFNDNLTSVFPALSPFACLESTNIGLHILIVSVE